MINGKTVLCLITARGGSKGLPGKSVRELQGKPLIAWTVEAAKNSRFVDRVILTTDSDEIADAGARFGADVPFMRPAEFATDLAKQEDAVLHAMNWCEKNDRAYDYLLLLTPTNPLRGVEDIDKGIESVANHPEAKAAITVYPCDHPPMQSNVIPDDLCLKDFMPDELKLKNRQEFPVHYQLSGAVCIIEWDYFKKEGTLLTPLTYALKTDSRVGLDIDTLKDFLLAEVYMANPDLV